ncbi:hypothetical protein Y71_19600 [Kosakonia radicincitans DSM 16656]|uniref:hypothetical protein n=1 Tax=Kosakonia radicincitans TaxID=283686 RepID=UPI000272EAA1|nr:hypothetical protein [Kosakonia radicincitans]ARD62019.1 hypothetical protein Y71_19600 [Kosakonia radicincitans DSM 16656]
MSLASNAVVKIHGNPVSAGNSTGEWREDDGHTRSHDKDDESFQARGRNFRPFLFSAILIYINYIYPCSSGRYLKIKYPLLAANQNSHLINPANLKAHIANKTPGEYPGDIKK